MLLTRAYLNSQSANAICAGNIAEALKCAGHEVRIISLEQADTVSGDESVHIVSLPIEYKKTEGWAPRIMSLLKLAKCETDRVLDQRIADLYYNKICALGQDNPFDIIVSFLFPLESAQAVAKYKEKNQSVQAIVYELDSAGDGIIQSRFPKLYNRTVERWLTGIYQIVDLVIIMQSHKEYWMKRFGIEFGKKVKIADLPVLLRKPTSITANGKELLFLYCGILDKKYRSPDYLLMILRELKPLIRFEFHFFSKGNCESRIAEESKTIPEIKQMGYVTKEELEKELINASILVSIGNSNSRSVPSKLIDYFSYGKPIIHFASQDDDICLEYLSKYPLALLINQNESLNESTAKIMRFINETKGKSVDYKDISRNYKKNTPDYSAAIIEGLLT